MNDLASLSDDDLRLELIQRAAALRATARELHSRESGQVDWHAFIRAHPELTSGRDAIIAQLHGFGPDFQSIIDAAMASVMPPPDTES